MQLLKPNLTTVSMEKTARGWEIELVCKAWWFLTTFEARGCFLTEAGAIYFGLMALDVADLSEKRRARFF